MTTFQDKEPCSILSGVCHRQRPDPCVRGPICGRMRRQVAERRSVAGSLCASRRTIPMNQTGDSPPSPLRVVGMLSMPFTGLAGGTAGGGPSSARLRSARRRIRRGVGGGSVTAFWIGDVVRNVVSDMEAADAYFGLAWMCGGAGGRRMGCASRP